MNRDRLAAAYIAAWNNEDVDAFVDLLHPQASYFDAFWGEVCNGSDLPGYFRASVDEDKRWYELDGDLIPTPQGFILRYKAFKRDDEGRSTFLFSGAEVITLAGEQIITVCDYYCESDPELLREVAEQAQSSHGRMNVVSLGLSARSAARIKRRLGDLANEMTVFLDPELTVTRLADLVSCSVMHLFHVLEEQMGTTFNRYTNECRARYASTVLVDHPDRDISLAKIADMSGFESISDLDEAFESTFGISIDEYVSRFGRAQTSR